MYMYSRNIGSPMVFDVIWFLSNELCVFYYWAMARGWKTHKQYTPLMIDTYGNTSATIQYWRYIWHLILVPQINTDTYDNTSATIQYFQCYTHSSVPNTSNRIKENLIPRFIFRILRAKLMFPNNSAVGCLSVLQRSKLLGYFS
jgi:hypothetical protein